MNQKQAVVSTILSTLEERDVTYEMGGETVLSDVLTDADKTTIKTTLFTMFRDNEVIYKPEFQAKVDNDAELKKYVSGLLNNWVRKNKEFNAGKAYVAKNPGSRAHTQDAQLKALTALSGTVEQGSDDFNEIATAIVARKAAITAEKIKTVTINVDALPDSLKHLVN